MVPRSGATQRPALIRLLLLALLLLVPLLATVRPATAQDTDQTGTVTGRVVDERGVGISGAQVFLVRRPGPPRPAGRATTR